MEYAVFFGTCCLNTNVSLKGGISNITSKEGLKEDDVFKTVGITKLGVLLELVAYRKL